MKPIPNFPDYFADEQGNIYSIKIFHKGFVREVPKMLKPEIGKRDGRRILRLHKDGGITRFSVATLILETFVSLRPEGMYACHGTRGCQDDSLDNVYWGTPSRNAQDRLRDGTDSRDAKNGNHKLNELQVRIIRRFWQMADSKYGTRASLVRIFNVSIPTIQRIVHNQAWVYYK